MTKQMTEKMPKEYAQEEDSDEEDEDEDVPLTGPGGFTG